LDNAIFVTLIDRLIDGSLPFVFYFQAIVDLRRATVVGYEALARFPLEIGLAPDICFQAAALCGRRLDLEEFVLARALEARQGLPPNCFLTINISPTFLLTERWDALLDKAGSLAGVVIEITEQDRIDDYNRIRPKIEAIRGRQGLVAVDDAGSGYASLKHIMELKPNFVKLDRFFIGNCHVERSKTTLIQMIGRATDRLDAWIVAEGVETEDELDELLRLDVPLAQGFFLGRPAPEMVPLTDHVENVLHSRAIVLERNGGLLEHTERCHIATTRAEAERLLDQHPESGLAVVLDEMERPLALLENHPLLGLRTVDPFMRVQISTDPSVTMHRALTRSAAQRFDPLAVIDELGKFQAVIRIDRLMRGILDARVS
jgi:EAL domain-containing protein (putative c-di-GMP-specific phosphodiesterase class I)